MPDISMCLSPTCPLRGNCYRHEESGTKPSEFRQAYMTPAVQGARCRYYWPIEEKELAPVLVVDNQRPNFGNN